MRFAPFSAIGSMALSEVANRTLKHLDEKSSRKSGTLMMIISDCYCDDGEFRSTGRIKTVKDA